MLKYKVKSIFLYINILINIHTHRHADSAVCLQRGSNFGSLMTGDGNLQVFAKTGFYKVSDLVQFDR